jgi:hypothetical protein
MSGRIYATGTGAVMECPNRCVWGTKKLVKTEAQQASRACDAELVSPSGMVETPRLQAKYD